MSAWDRELDDFLLDSGLAAPHAPRRWTALSGGVSSDIWRVELPDRVICVKRALRKLKVAADWEVPVERNTAEWDYLQWVHGLAPGQVPRPIVRDSSKNAFAMEWLAPDDHRLWKSELLAGCADRAVAEAVGDLLGRIHAASARDPSLPRRFAHDATFHAIRLEPYLLTVARLHPDLSQTLQRLAQRTATTRKALVHGDVSPKNILLGPSGPVLIDAECAWFGDPAFDLAFCLNHLAIKQRVIEGSRQALGACFDGFYRSYLPHVDWEPPSGLESRTATLLPALALARVDGKSPLDYLTVTQRASLVDAARALLLDAPTTLAEVRQRLSIEESH